MSDAALVNLSNASRALAECKTVMQTKGIMDAAEAARVYLARTNASVEAVNEATEIKTLAERQMGEFLAQMPKDEGGRPSKETGNARVPVFNDDATLAEIGISKNQSSQAQKLAAIPEPEFKERIEHAKKQGKPITRAGMLRPVEEKPQGTVEVVLPRGFKVSVGMQVAASVIQHIKSINAKDGEYIAAHEEIIAFCQQRISNRK